MKLPLPIDYQQALQTPSVAFVDQALRRSRPRLTPLGLPATASGGFALTFDVTVDRTRYAIRCFHKQGNHLQQRYAGIADFVRTTRLDFLVDVDYLHAGIRVGGHEFPVIRMRWVDGTRLDDWIDDHLDEPAALTAVRRNLAAAVAELRRHGAAHGDLQHGNVLVRSDGSVRLVDYDGMYLPALREYGTAEQGHRNYQHPERSTQYDDSLDLFAACAIDLSLAAVAHDARLWKEFNRNRASGESLLFTAEDFTDPATSPVFAQLARVPELRETVQRLRRACEVGFDEVPMALSGAAVPAAATRRRSPGSTAPPAPTALAATDRAALLVRQGDEVTVVGRILKVKATSGPRGGAITFLNFGNHLRGDFTVVAFARASQDLARSFGNPQTLAGAWVAITGLLTVYQRSTRAPVTPQIELRRARMLRTLTAAEAAARLGVPRPARDPDPPPAAGTAAASASGSGSGSGSPSLDDRLGRLYSSPAFRARMTPTGPGPGSRPSTRPNPTVPPRPAAASGPTVPPPGTAVPPASAPPTSAPPISGPRTSPPASAPRTPPPQQRPPRYVPTRPYSPNPPLAANQPPYPPPLTNPPPYPPPNTAAWYPTTRSTGLGVAALVAALCFGPAGVVLALVALARKDRQSETDRVCAWIGLVIGALATLAFGCSILTTLLSSVGQQQ